MLILTFNHNIANSFAAHSVSMHQKFFKNILMKGFKDDHEFMSNRGQLHPDDYNGKFSDIFIQRLFNNKYSFKDSDRNSKACKNGLTTFFSTSLCIIVLSKV